MHLSRFSRLLRDEEAEFTQNVRSNRNGLEVSALAGANFEHRLSDILLEVALGVVGDNDDDAVPNGDCDERSAKLVVFVV